MTGFTALLARDLRLVWRRPGDVMVVLAFFVVATVLFPLGIGPETNLLARIAAGILWCAALFAALLSLERLFAADYEDGALDLLLLAPWPLELAALAKCLAHWIVTGLPLALLAPLMGLLFGLSGDGPGRGWPHPAGRHADAVADRRAGGGADPGRPARRGFAGPARPAALRADPDLRRRRGRGGGDRRGFSHAPCDPGRARAAVARDPAVGNRRCLAASGRIDKLRRRTNTEADGQPACPCQPGALPPLQPARAAGAVGGDGAGARRRPVARAGRIAARLPAGRDGAHHVHPRAVGLAVDDGLRRCSRRSAPRCWSGAIRWRR